MFIFGVDTHDDNFLSIDDFTTDFIVCIFGFFPHNMSENLEAFFEKELKIKYSNKLEKFQLNGDVATHGYDVTDRRTFDYAYVLPKVFSSKNDAENYISDAIKNSDYVFKKLFTDIEVLDAHKIKKRIQECVDYQKSQKKAENTLNREIYEFKKQLKEKYKNDKLILELIGRKF